MSLGVVRVRGTANIRRDVRDTLEMLHLPRPNHCVVVPPREEYLGMLRKTKDYVTWGELNPEVLSKLLTSKARVMGDRPLTAEFVKKSLGFPSLKALSKALVDGEAEMTKLEGVKPVFRLHPPKRGYEGTKRPYANGGALGYRGESINDLILRMLD